MRRKYLGLAFAFLLISSGLCKASEAIPAKDILEAARIIKPATGPFYSVEGVLKCSLVASEVPPYHTEHFCSITVDERVQELANPEAILSVLTSKVKPMTGPVYLFQGKFKATAISREFPPYGADEQATVFYKPKAVLGI